MKPDPLKRIHAIDALRGFALAGIFLVHMNGQFMAGAPTIEMKEVMIQGPLDLLINQLTFWGMRGKFFALFSMLFGMSFFILMDRAAQRGINFRPRFVWRLVVLFIIGLIHSVIYSGDILVFYSVIGLFMVPFYQANSKTILAVALFFFLGGGRFIAYGIFGNSPILFSATHHLGVEEYVIALMEGNLLDVLKLNFLKMPEQANYQIQGYSGKGYLTFGFFLLGLWMGRSRLLQDIGTNIDKLKKIIIWAFVFALGMIPLVWYMFSKMDNIYVFRTWWSMLSLTAYDLFNLFLAIIIALGFIYLFSISKGERILKVFAPYGRMALTNYVFQSIVGTFIFYHWGLGYLGTLRNLELVILGLILITAQIILSTYWLKIFKYGPLEWLWRSLTYLKIQPFMKRSIISSSTVQQTSEKA